MIALSWQPFGGLRHFRDGDVDCGRWLLWTLVVDPPRQEDMISHLYLQRDFNDCQRWAECCLYHGQYSHDHHFCSLHLFDWFLRGHREVHLHPFQFPQHIPSLLAAQRCLFGHLVGMKHEHSSPRRKRHLTVIVLLRMLGPISSKV